MHVHANLPNPNVALNALRSAEKTTAKLEAEFVRKKLMESASELAGESGLDEACVLKLNTRKEPQKQPKGRDKRNEQNSRKPEDSTGSGEADEHISKWA